MTNIENFLNARKDSVVFYKVNLLLDIEFDSDTYIESNKLSSFFGQIGVYENSEKLLSLVKNLYKDLYFSFLLFKEKSDFKESGENLEMFFKVEENIFDYGNNVEEIFNKDCQIQQDLENEENEQDDDEEGEEYFFFFLPLIMIFYRGDRKMDYYLGNEFKEKLYFKKKIAVFKEKLNLKKFLKKNFFFKKNYKKNFFFKKFSRNKKNFFNMIKNNSIVFIVKDFLKYHFFDIKKKFRLKKKKRFRMFRKLKLKFRSKVLYLCKDNKWWSSTYLLLLLNLKFFFLSNYYSHKTYLTGIFNFFSQMINIKKKFFKRYRRKRKFKRDFFRNFFGKRAKLNIVLNILEEEKKKKKGKKKVMLKKNLYKSKYSIYTDLLKVEEIKIYFVIYSTNKSVENLIYNLNSLMFNNKIEKVKELNKTTFFSVTIPIKNYFILKENLGFKIKEESLKFEFISIKFKNNSFSINFFEENFLKNNSKQEFFEDLMYFNYLNFFKNKIFLIKLFFIIIFNFISLINNFKKLILKKI